MSIAYYKAIIINSNPHFSSPKLAIARKRPKTITPSFIPSPAVRAVPASLLSARRLSNAAAINPVTAPTSAPNIRVLLLFMVWFPFYLALGGVLAAGDGSSSERFYGFIFSKNAIRLARIPLSCNTGCTMASEARLIYPTAR